jgi:hypothetical protein
MTSNLRWTQFADGISGDSPVKATAIQIRLLASQQPQINQLIAAFVPFAAAS